jgi:hypothetical protein
MMDAVADQRCNAEVALPEAVESVGLSTALAEILAHRRAQ